MTNLLTFYGSCGHVVVEHLLPDEWLEAAECNYNLECSDGLFRMVYVRPRFFFLCKHCVEEEIFSDEFATLRFFFNSPLVDKEERQSQTLALGRSMLPDFSDDRIIEIASNNG